MEKTLIHFDQQRFTRAQVEFEQVKKIFQPMVDAYSKTDLSPLERTDLSKLLEQPGEFIIDKILEGKNLEIGGMKISRSKALEFLELTPGQKAFIAIAKETAKSFNDYKNSPLTNQGRNIDYFAIVENQVIVEENAINKVTQSCSISTDCKKQKSVLKKVNQIILLINQLIEEDGHGVSTELFLQNALIQGGLGGKVSINPGYITSIK